MLKVWGRTNSINVQKVLWTAAELGLDVDRTDAGGAFGGLDDPGFRAMNPHGRIPVVQDGDATLWESNAVVRYLASRYGRGSLWDDDPASRAASDAWMDWQATAVSPPTTTLLFNRVRLPEPERDPAAAAKAEAALNAQMRTLEGQLSGGPAYLVGDALTIGDIPVGCAVHRYLALPIARPDLPALEAYRARLAARPAYAAHVMLPLT